MGLEKEMTDIIKKIREIRHWYALEYPFLRPVVPSQPKLLLPRTLGRVEYSLPL